MSTEIFWKKRISLVITGLLATAFVVGMLLYAHILTGVQKVPMQNTFYFVALNETHVEAGAHFITQTGGAGYVLESGERERVVFSVYLKESEAKAVQASLAEYNQETDIVVCRTNALYLQVWEGENAQQVSGAFSSLYGCIEVLNAEIKRLDEGATQESSKRILSELKRQLDFLNVTYMEEYPSFAKSCQQIAFQLEKCTKGVVLAKDLRFVLCELCVSYLNFAEEFSL